MVNFAKLIRDDFMRGTVIFVGHREDSKDIEDTLFATESGEVHLVYRTHPVSGHIFFGYRDAHPYWHGEELFSEEAQYWVTIPWETVTDTVNNLSNNTVEEIFQQFIDSKAYINLLDMNEDVSCAIDALCEIADHHGVKGCDEDDDNDDVDTRRYIGYLESDCFKNLFVDREYSEGELDLNAAHACGVGTESSSVAPSIVYPIAYIAKKMRDEDHGALYTEEDFDNIFN